MIIMVIIPNCLVSGKSNKTEIISSGHYGKGYRYNIQGWVYVHVEGEPYERGYQYGYLTSAEIVDMINRWSNWGHEEKIMKLFIIKNLLQNYDKLPEQWWEICKSKAARIFWKQFPEEYQQEIKGIADGVRARGGTVHGRLVDYKDILTLNVIEETRWTFKNPGGRGRPFKVTFNRLKMLFLGNFKKEVYEPGHCSAFIATGNATVDGRIVMAHSTIFPPNYIPQRANLIVDIQPSNGHRFIMASFPGYIWSSEDYYQNDCGILLMETSLVPQGPWTTKGTKPVGVRARRAIQYSDCIDDIIQSFLNGNNGLYPNDWVMGDTKTGEIASLELALNNHAVTRTKNGVLWSCCNVKDDKVRWELWGVFGFGILGRIFSRKFQPNARDIKFSEMSDKYYGKIDVDIVKKIMSTEPISTKTTDCKITDSQLVENLGLWIHMGNPDGNVSITTPELEKKLKGITDLFPIGWVKIYASISKPLNLPPINNIKDNEENSKLLWDNKTGETFVTSTVSKDLVFVITDTELHAMKKGTSETKWKQPVIKINSKPTIYKDTVITSCSNGEIYAFNIETGEIEWTYSFPDSSFISEVQKSTMLVGSGDTCYAFDIPRRKTIWEYQTDGPITISPKIDGETVYFGSWDGNVYALDSKTGEIKWIYETGWGIETTPAVADGKVFVGSLDNNFYALDKKTGESVWYYTCKAAIHSSPVVYGEYVFFGSDDGRLYALDKANGELAWSFAPGHTIKNDNINNYITTPILSAPFVENGVVYIDAKGTIYALDAQTKETPEERLDSLEIENNNLLFIIILLMSITIVTLLFFFNKYKK